MFGESATAELERASTEIRSNKYLQPFASAGRIEFGQKSEKMQLLRGSKLKPNRGGAYGKPPKPSFGREEGKEEVSDEEMPSHQATPKFKP